MNIPSLPVSNLGVLPRVIESLAQDVKTMKEKPEEVLPRHYVAAWATASLGALVLGTIDHVINVLCIAIKAVPVGLNELVGKVTDYSRYIDSYSWSGEDFVKHFANIRRTLLIQLNAVAVLVGLSSPKVLTKIANKIEMIPVPQLPVDKSVDAQEDGKKDNGANVEPQQPQPTPQPAP
jgi:hypothetical protein